MAHACYLQCNKPEPRSTRSHARAGSCRHLTPKSMPLLEPCSPGLHPHDSFAFCGIVIVPLAHGIQDAQSAVGVPDLLQHRLGVAIAQAQACLQGAGTTDAAANAAAAPPPLPQYYASGKTFTSSSRVRARFGVQLDAT